jgi:hypothetical protein
MDPVPAGASLQESFTADFIWDVSSPGLATGTYLAELVIHDGDEDRGVGRVTIAMTSH